MSKPWTDEDDKILEEMYRNKERTKDIANALQRTQGSVNHRIGRLKLTSKYEDKRFTNNEYDLSGEYGVGYTKKGEKFYFDLDDYEKIKEFSWCIDTKGYVKGNIRGKSKQKDILQHRLIMGCTDPNIQVDHIYRNKNDNRKSKLRIVTNQQNHMNKNLLKNNTSGFTGVSFNSRRGKWKASIMLNNRNISLGNYEDKEDAISARKEAEIKYFGEYRRMEEGVI